MNTDHEIETALSRITGGHVLDVATGSGWVLEWLADTLASTETLTGVDAQALASSGYVPADAETIFASGRATFQQMDAHALEFPDDSFDTVSIANSLHHMADPAAVLREMRRVLKPGGTFILYEMRRDGLSEQQLTHVYWHHWWAAIDRARGVVHNETFTRAELVAFAQMLAPQSLTLFDIADTTRDPFDAEWHAVMLRRRDHALEQVRDLPDAGAYAARAEELTARLAEVGIQTATTLVAIACV